MNVKTPNKGKHQRNIYMEPLNNNEDEKIYLAKFLDWLELGKFKIKNSKLSNIWNEGICVLLFR